MGSFTTAVCQGAAARAVSLTPRASEALGSAGYARERHLPDGQAVSLLSRAMLRRVLADVAQIGPVGSRAVTIFSSPHAVDGSLVLIQGLKASVLLDAQRSRRVAHFGGPVTKLRRTVPRIRRRDELTQFLGSPLQCHTQLPDGRVSLLRCVTAFVGDAFPLVGRPLAPVGDLFALVGRLFALVRCLLPLAKQGFPGVQERLPGLGQGLVLRRLRRGEPVVLDVFVHHSPALPPYVCPLYGPAEAAEEAPRGRPPRSQRHEGTKGHPRVA
jgi:hypothetical protein